MHYSIDNFAHFSYHWQDFSFILCFRSRPGFTDSVMVIEGCMKDDVGDLASPELIPAERRDQPYDNQRDDVAQGAPLRYDNTISIE